MLKKLVLGAAALFATATALPAAAEAHGYRDGYRYSRHYDAPRYDPYYRGYDRRGYYDRGYYDRGAYQRGYPGGGYYGQTYGYRDSYRGRRTYGRCGNGTTGAIVGGAAGALLGREIGRGGRYYGYRRGGSGTVGALIGGAAGALIGREVGRSC
jgi:hypothetical protein